MLKSWNSALPRIVQGCGSSLETVCVLALHAFAETVLDGLRCSYFESSGGETFFCCGTSIPFNSITGV